MSTENESTELDVPVETASLEQVPATDVQATDVQATDEQAIEQQPQTFDAEYVKSLRAEAAEYRVKAKRVDALAAQALHALATADGRLIDASDLHFDDSLTAKDGTIDVDKVTEAISELIRAKPHLMKQRPTTPVAQGARATHAEPNLLQLIKGA